jgi:hypothetical protein
MFSYVRLPHIRQPDNTMASSGTIEAIQLIKAGSSEIAKKGSRLYKYKLQKKLVFCPTTKRLEAFGTMRATLSCAESEAMDAASYTIKEQLLSEALVLLDKRELRICVLYRCDPYPRRPPFQTVWCTDTNE